MRIAVVIAILRDPINRILITQRAASGPLGGYWEFPGGKIESHETPELALQREIKEELDVEILDFHFLTKVHHVSVSLAVYEVLRFWGEPQCLAGQVDLRWVDGSELDKFQFPEANSPIIQLLQ